MKALMTAPKADGFRMPGEFEKHRGTIMIWPVRPGSWPYEAKNAKKVFAKIACTIAQSEELYMLADDGHINEAENVMYEVLCDMTDKNLISASMDIVKKNIKILPIESDDSWARDVAPTFLVNDKKEVRGVNWSFNAWGGEYDGLYKSWEKDDRVAENFLEMTEELWGADCDGMYYDASPFVLEGGSIHSDGEGTVLVTESCLLSKGRNPKLTKHQIENKLMEYLGAEKVIWLPRGIYNDETNEHVDNVCAFVKPAEVVLAWTDKENDSQYPLSKACMDILKNTTDAKGRRIKVHKMYIPDKMVCITKDELDGYEFEEDEDTREVGERLAASYVNFYICNGMVLVPQFDDDNDKKAVELLETLFKDRKIIPVYARDIIVGGGNIHCITQQIPV